jgi:hypothetical protein
MVNGQARSSGVAVDVFIYDFDTVSKGKLLTFPHLIGNGNPMTKMWHSSHKFQTSYWGLTF